MVASAVFFLFISGLMYLFRSGQTASNQSYWLQKTATQLRNTFNHLNMNLQRSSYPATIIFPGKIVDNSRNDFKVHLSTRLLLPAKEAKEVKSSKEFGTQFLRFTESSPERKNFEINNPASLTYHIYSLTKAGKILYHRYMESVSTDLPLFIGGIRRTHVPPEEAVLVEARELVDDVESIKVDSSSQATTTAPVSLEITCANPRGQTRRSEHFVGVPNVEVYFHPFDPDW